jgi:lysophospholipase L1-like esterase
MGVMGDSLTAAALADLPIPNAGPAAEDRIRAWAVQGNDSRIIFENKSTFSWATGHRISSHYLRLQNWLHRNGDKRRLDALNVAYPGNTSYALAGQVKQIVQAMASGKYDALKYTTILIGANDACSTATPTGTPTEILRANVFATLQQLAGIRQDEPTRVMVVGIPRIPNLATPEFRKASTIFGLSCETVRNKILRECDSLLSWTTPEEYSEKMQIVDDVNRTLRQVVEEANATFPNLQVIYSNRLYDLAIPVSVLAIDCFHPNPYGQSALSDQVWMDQPWFD